ncbi:MAG: S-layer homology domain-containing protein, partial [Chloroflexota bacterium]|nr:S-layer homology domain-containing protein [Chloroflexota bacterium]
MKEVSLQGRNWKPWAVLMMMMFVAVMSAGAAFAALPTGKGLPAAPNAPHAVLHDQFDGANGAVFSTCNSGNCNDNRHSQAADDFTVPGGQTWTLTGVDVIGNLIGGSTQPGSFNVFFYSDSSTLPGTPVFSYTTGTSYVTDGTAYTITIPSTVLSPGTYWVSVQANTTVTGNNWQWANRANTPPTVGTSTIGAAFRGTVVGGCTNWNRKPNCFSGTYSGEPEQVFRLHGTADVDATATPTNTNTPTQTATATHIVQPELYCQITGGSDPIQSTTNFGSQTADDFVVPAGPGWSINQVDVNGQLSGGVTEPTSFNVFFYNDSGTLPGTSVVTYTGQTYTKNVSTGIYTINIPATNLAPGSYWLSVQASGGSNWFWSGRDPQTNDGAAIRGGSCGANWVDRSSCSATSPYTTQDQAFCVRGADIRTPTVTSSSTSTPTNTATNTSTATQTSTATRTSTSTNTATATTTSTSTSTPTGTFVPPTATNTAVPASSTATRTATAVASSTVVVATSTVVATATVCTVNFPDNQPGDTFYEYIQCLACRGIVTGYPDGMFHAERNITRGQISKMVSNAAGFNEDPGPQIYQDVPPGSTYYAYINRLTNRGIMSGYPCPERPEGDDCDPDNPVIFLPNANATRGQLSKIVSNAAGFNEAVSGQFYADVPEEGQGSQFYEWIMRLTNRGVM